MAQLVEITQKAYLVHEEMQNMDFSKQDKNQFLEILKEIINDH